MVNTIQSGTSSNLSSGAIAGIVIGVVVFIILFIVGVISFSRHHSQKRHEHAMAIQRDRNLKGEVRKRDGTMVGDTVRPKLAAMGMGGTYYESHPEHDKV